MYAIQVFQDAMLAHADGYRMGLPTCPLSQLYEKLPCRDVRLGVRVGEICFEGKRASGVKLADGEMLAADAVVLATNHHAVQKWVDASLDDRIGPLAKLEDVPILGAHLWFDRPVMTDSHAALFGGPLQWLFRKDASGSVLHGVISAAREWVGRSKEESLKLFEEQVRAVLPEAREAKLVRGVIVIEKRATYSPGPGVDQLRPGQAAAPEVGIENLFLAGDYTLTGWPATMEGAVRSGYLAAEALLARFGGTTSCFLVADLPAQWPARLLGLDRMG
jgi:glycine/D-amino acid oxidase-like deaminating enzyme